MNDITDHPMLRVVYSAALLRPKLADIGFTKAVAYIRSRAGSCGGVSCNTCPFYVRGIVPGLSGHWCLTTMVPQGAVQESVYIRYRLAILKLLEGQ